MKKKIRNIFITGLFAIIPIYFTFVLLGFLFTKLDNILSPLISKLLIYLNVPIPEGFHIPGLGILATVIIIFATGLFTTNFFGKKVVEVGERTLTKIPLVSSIYFSAKQLIEAFSMSSKGAFRQVVLIEYPRRGIYSMGFVTSDAYNGIRNLTGEDLVNIFIPTTPNPTSGLLIMVPQKDVTYLPINVDEGIKLIISGGIFIPKSNNKEIKA